jgi:hypothetical protein
VQTLASAPDSGYCGGVYLFVALLHHIDAAEKAVERFRTFGLGEPLMVRARSAAAVLSAEVPIFGGLKSLALGADEDRLVALSFVATAQEEAERLLARVQLEMDADDPPMGRLFAVPVLAPPTTGRH